VLPDEAVMITHCAIAVVFQAQDETDVVVGVPWRDMKWK